MTNHESLSRATKELMLKEPFYGLFLIMMNKVWRNDLDTAGVSKQGINTQLAINPHFWEGLSSQYRVGILKHELLHIAMQHLTLRDRYTHKRLFNIAADLEINQFIDRAYLPGGNYPSKEAYEKDTGIFIESIKERLEKGELTKEKAREEILKIPMRVLFLEDFKELNLEPKKGTDYYYKKLLESMDQNGESSCDALNSALGKGNPHPGEAPWTHKTWDEFDSLSEAEKKMVQKQIDYQLKEIADQVSKSRGTVPGELKNYIDSLNAEEPPKFDWKGYLRRFTGGSIKTYTKKTRRKPSKRFAGSPGLRVKTKKHILVGIDTSGSVSDDELVEIFHEIHHMYKTGAEVTVIQCDTAISNIASYRKPEDGKIKVHGRGGTDFQPVVDYYNEHQREFSCLIYLTDGEAPAPSPRARGRMLWVLTSKSQETDRFSEPTIKLN
jgi:predicted metal-dependent peptidase